MSKKDLIPIEKNKLVKSYRYGSTLELSSGHGQYENDFKVISGKRYINTKTGEIFEMDTNAVSREDNLDEVRRTMKKLRRLVAHNFDGGINQLWVTLTYAEKTTDTKKVSHDYELFMKRLRRKHPGIEYISIIEPQASGSWHFHVLLKVKTGKVLYISNKDLENMWGKGFTKTKRLKNGDKVGNYVVTYLSNLELTDEDGKSTGVYAKGQRLHYYPKGLRIYRTSRGIERPIEETQIKEDILKYHQIKSKPDYVKKTTYPLADGTEKEYITEFYNI